jgi:hypothetical protein
MPGACDQLLQGSHLRLPSSAGSPPVIDSTQLPLQVKDKWGFQMTARYEMYAELLTNFTKLDYQPQVIKDPSLQ